MQSNFKYGCSTSSESIYEQWCKSNNVVTKWALKNILESRASSGDVIAKKLHNVILNKE